MTQQTKIEWTEQTWNPIVGCSLASPGCTNCYAMRTAYRMSQNPKTPQYHGTAKLVNGKPVFTGKLALVEKALLEPLKRRKPTTYFVNSMGDLFHEDMPDDWIDRVFAVMALCPQHTFQVLTKRADRMRDYVLNAFERIDELLENARQCGEDWTSLTTRIEVINDGYNGTEIWPLPNIWLGVSVEDQKRADERIPDLFATPAAIRFISAEPLLGPVSLRWLNAFPENAPYTGMKSPAGTNEFDGLARLDQVIVGGESGPNARPMHPDWARSLRDQCKAAGTAFFFKQHGKWLHESQDPNGVWDWETADQRGILHCWESDEPFTFSIPLKKSDAGRSLDGVEHNGFPAALMGATV
jgi:protein gp37